MKILLVDDHPVVRQGIRMILAGSLEGLECVEAATGGEALAAVRSRDFDLVVLDINLPDQNGFSVLQEIQASHPKLPVLIMSVQPEEHMAVRALKSGASGFLNKEAAPDEMIKAVQTAVAGRKFVSPRLAEWLAMEVSGHREGLPHERLSDREYQVMCMLAMGQSVNEIAQALGRSANTVSTFRTRVLRKMNLDNNASLTKYALTHRLIK